MKTCRVVLIVALLVSACGAPSHNEAEEKSTSLENSLSTQLDALEKSKGVEQSLQQAAEQRRIEIENRGG